MNAFIFLALNVDLTIQGTHFFSERSKFLLNFLVNVHCYKDNLT